VPRCRLHREAFGLESPDELANVLGFLIPDVGERLSSIAESDV
jgi:hypothetical protein